MNTQKRESVTSQYIDQYKPVIDNTLLALRANKDSLHIPYAQFLFSIIDYYGLLYTVATTGMFNKRDKNNFISFFGSKYFPETDRCKGSFLYFVRNGLIHQIFSKGSSVGSSTEEKLFFKDIKNGDIPCLNLDYLDSKVINAIEALAKDIQTDANYVNNLHDKLITTNYGLNDQNEFDTELANSLNSDIDMLFSNCI